jgi:hypothetical protein
MTFMLTSDMVRKVPNAEPDRITYTRSSYAAGSPQRSPLSTLPDFADEVSVLLSFYSFYAPTRTQDFVSVHNV